MSDRDDIIDLTIAYTWALDTKNIEGLREVFLPDATADLRGRWCEGIDAIMARIGGSEYVLGVLHNNLGATYVRRGEIVKMEVWNDSAEWLLVRAGLAKP